MTPEELYRLRRLLAEVQPDISKEKIGLVERDSTDDLLGLLSADSVFMAWVLMDYIRAKAYLLFLEENPRSCERRWMKYDELRAGYEERVWEELASVLGNKDELLE